jgi:DNA-binding transcriptional MerR regulator
MTIGRFGRLTGLSTHTLRHYDEVGLLSPAEIDASSRYRRYRRDQAGLAGLIARLRWMDLPIDEIRAVLAHYNDTAAADLLEPHHQRLARRLSLLSAQIENLQRLITEGITMTTAMTGCHPVQIKISVDDRDAAIAFYQSAFGLRYDVSRRTDDHDHSSFVTGDYGKAGFFLMQLIDEGDFDRPGPSTFGLLVDDLDERHSAALAAGGTEAVPPHSPQGMPRCSAVKDPSGNWIWLYQG